MTLLDEWANWSAGSPPYLLRADRALLLDKAFADDVVSIPSWREASAREDFCAPGDTRVHLGLIPQPFIGDVKNASVYILLLNPGLGPGDYYAESEVPAFRSALLANLKQTNTGGFPFIFLDPRFSWHGGFVWWHKKLARVMEQLAGEWNVSFAEARARVASRIASIELFPYHSASFRSRARWLNLPSVDLARAFVQDVIRPRAKTREVTVIVLRKVKEWGLTPSPGIVIYDKHSARGAHLTPTSRGGRAIVRQLKDWR